MFFHALMFMFSLEGFSFFSMFFIDFFFFYQIGETKCVFCTNGRMKIENGLGDYWLCKGVG